VKWAPFQFGDQTFELAHLDPFDFELVVPERDGKPELRLIIKVEFGLHCFTKDYCEENNVYSSDFEYSDSRETRYFNSLRYELSKQLPRIVTELPSRRCFFSDDPKVFLLVHSIEHEGKKKDYQVFFQLNPTSQSNVLKLFVASAFLRESYRKPQARNPLSIRFGIIALNRSIGKPILKPPRK
jgi:hypothetical protein